MMMHMKRVPPMTAPEAGVIEEPPRTTEATADARKKVMIISRRKAAPKLYCELPWAVRAPRVAPSAVAAAPAPRESAPPAAAARTAPVARENHREQNSPGGVFRARNREAGK